MNIMKTILVPVDLSIISRRVCNEAALLAGVMKARLFLLHVVQNTPYVMNDFYGLDIGAVSTVVDAARQSAEKKLKAFARRYAKGDTPVDTLTTTGSPSVVIRKHAKSLKAAYIVIGSHGHGAVFNLLVGSTTQGVLRTARCPVLVVPVSPS